MPRYFYDIAMASNASRDDVGVVCEEDGFALKQAWAALPMLVGDADASLSWQHYELIVRREDGLQVARLGVTINFEELNPAARELLASKDDTKPLLD